MKYSPKQPLSNSEIRKGWYKAEIIGDDTITSKAGVKYDVLAIRLIDNERERTERLFPNNKLLGQLADVFGVTELDTDDYIGQPFNIYCDYSEKRKMVVPFPGVLHKEVIKYYPVDIEKQSVDASDSPF